MQWEDERYIRVYTRDTPDWTVWPWQSRALLPLLMRKLDRMGLMELGKHGTVALAALVGLPIEVVSAGLDGLIADGCVVQSGTKLVMRNFIAGQEAVASGSLRQKTWREREKIRDETLRHVDETLANVDGARRDETDGDAARRRETPNLAVPSLAVDLKALSTSQAKLDDVREVFSYWQQVMGRPRTKLDDVRRRKIQARLSEGRTVADIKLAIDGCSMRAHNMGDNENGTAYNDIELICRNGPKFDAYLLTAEEAKRPAASPAYHRETDEEIEQRILGGKHAV